MRKLTRAFAPIVFVLSLLLSSCALPMPSSSMISMDELPAYSDSAYVEIDGNQPFFTDADKQETEAFEEYSDLDYLGRCGTAYANVGQELMPADGEKRGSIGQVKPTGWHTVKYDCVDGKYLYNRCHLDRLAAYRRECQQAEPRSPARDTSISRVCCRLRIWSLTM